MRPHYHIDVESEKVVQVPVADVASEQTPDKDFILYLISYSHNCCGSLHTIQSEKLQLFRRAVERLAGNSSRKQKPT